jgi:CheY-like chemotaxis protein
MAYTFGGLMVTSVRRPPLVLLVDDDEYIHALVARTLRRLPAETLAVRSGHDGLVVARRRPPDLILLDLALPDIDGFVLLRAFRFTPATRDVPIVIVSGLAGHPALGSAEIAGMVGKPFRAATLLGVVTAALHQPPREPLPELQPLPA